MEKKIIMRYFNINTSKQKASVGLFFFFIFLKVSYAQDFKLAGIKYVNYQKSEIKNDLGNQEISFQEFGTFVNFPKKLKNDKTVLVNGFGYGFVEASFDNPLFQPSQNEEKLQTFFYQLTLLHQWNEKWNLLVNLKPTLASDFEAKLSSDDFIFQGAVTATRKFSSSFKLGGGLAYSARLGSPRLIPLINLQYKNNKHEINAFLPISAKYSYSLLPNNKLDLGVKYNLNGGNFNVHSDDNSIDKINYSRANFGVTADYQLTKLLRLEAFGGVSAGRKYSLIDADDITYDFDSESAPFFSVGIVLVPPKRK
ncbi:hypothetical protein LPB136_03495 [Tenacibaculum todarodis]|uniref:DUF6268 domain-containing protein n=1 Tax=Tenacibaculum todarodis TaxID=1850252 RepID=A0A1L3JHE1_9FLAO|nr:DUF6268 family outer membrane beta-barrel protein [Tenacibaculum todarodis]APG64483.1 hypothetical protein LPB136_03495 [Tenacibaculum todarodis]